MRPIFVLAMLLLGLVHVPIYKGARSESDLQWRDYLIEFGPGSQLKFSVGLDEAARIASVS